MGEASTSFLCGVELDYGEVPRGSKLPAGMGDANSKEFEEGPRGLGQCQEHPNPVVVRACYIISNKQGREVVLSNGNLESSIHC